MKGMSCDEEPLSKQSCLGAVSKEEWKSITDKIREVYAEKEDVSCSDDNEKRRGRPRDKDKARRSSMARRETVDLVNACPGLYTSVWSLFEICSTMNEKDRLAVLEDWCGRWCDIRRMRYKGHGEKEDTITMVFGNPLFTMVKGVCVDNPRRTDTKAGFFSYQMKQFTFQVLEIMVLMEAISCAVGEVVAGSRSVACCTRILSCQRQFIAWLHTESGPGKRHGDILYCGDDSDVNARRVIMDGLYFHHIQRTEIESKKAGVACVMRKDKTIRQLNADEHMLRPHLAWSSPLPIHTRTSDDGHMVFIECGGVVLRADRPSENLPLGVDIESCRHLVGRSLGPYERGKIKKVAVGRIKTILLGTEYPECLRPPLNPSMNDSYGADGPGMLRWKRILNRRGPFAMKQAIRVSKRNRLETGDAMPATGTWGMFESPEIVDVPGDGVLRAVAAALHPINKDREFYGYAQLLYKKKIAIVSDFCLWMCTESMGDRCLVDLNDELGLSPIASMISHSGDPTTEMDAIIMTQLAVGTKPWTAVDAVMADITANVILLGKIRIGPAAMEHVVGISQNSAHHFTALQDVYFRMLDVLCCHGPLHVGYHVWERHSQREISLGHGLYITYGSNIASHKGVYEYLKLPWLPNPEETEPDNLDRRGYSWVGAAKKKKRNLSGGDEGVDMSSGSSAAISSKLLLCGICEQLAVAPVQCAPHAVACMACVWNERVGWIGMDFECPPRHDLIATFPGHERRCPAIPYTPEVAFRFRTRPGAWQAIALSNLFLAPAKLAQNLIHEEVKVLHGDDAIQYDARRLVEDDVEEAMTTIWDQAHGLTVDNNSGHWHITYTDDNRTPHCRMWHQAPDSNVILRRDNDDIVWQPQSAQDMAQSIQSDDVTAYVMRTSGSCNMFRLQGKTAMDIWDAWTHNSTAETEYARQLGIAPFSLSHLMVTFALVKNSGMEQMIMDEWTRSKDAIPFHDNATFSFLGGKSLMGSLPSILRHSYAGSINSNFDALVDKVIGPP